MHIVILITSKDKNEADKISRHLVEHKLAACVNIVPNIQSVYRWEGKVSSDQEVLMIAKSRQDLFEEVLTTVKSMHSYSVPEIIALPISAGNEDYLNWINESTQGK